MSTDDHATETAPVQWIPPHPTEVPALHADLRRWLFHPFSFTITINAIEAGHGTLVPAAPTPLHAASILHTEEHARLGPPKAESNEDDEVAGLYSLDHDTTVEARAQGGQLHDLAVQPTDLPTPQGLVIFDSPIGYSHDGGPLVPIVGCSLGTVAPLRTTRGRGMAHLLGRSHTRRPARYHPQRRTVTRRSERGTASQLASTALGRRGAGVLVNY